MSGMQWIVPGVIVLAVTAAVFAVGRLLLWREKKDIEETWRSKGREERSNEEM